jgi:NAD(P)-dependent dehydrogenase (short-subunit alcohol dehydrogenase family)
MNTEVMVVIGVGGIGQAIARRQGPGRSVVIADSNEATLASAAKELDALGYTVTARRYTVTARRVDVSERGSSRSLAQAASLTWGARGARVNCISPGIIATPMARQEMAGPALWDIAR